MATESIPKELTDEKRWVCWQYKERGGKTTKVPKQPSGRNARSDSPDTWTHYSIASMYSPPAEEGGIGFMLGDEWAGVDVDNCLVNGELTDEAQRIVTELDSYTEISPSGNGVKIFVRGVLPKGRSGFIGDQRVEIYPHGRYFAVTGRHVEGTPKTVNEASAALASLAAAVVSESCEARGADESEPTPYEPTGDDDYDACLAALSRMPESVEGSNGSGAFFAACCEAVRHGLNRETTLQAIEWYNAHRCHPRWEGFELQHKIDNAYEAAAPTPADQDFEGPTRRVATPRSSQRVSLDLEPHADFMRQIEPPKFQVQDVLVQGDHGVIGGEPKTFKTTIMVDLCVSLTSGKPFLDRFIIPQVQPAIIVSGESGKRVLQQVARRVEQARGAKPKELYWGTRLPRLSEQCWLDALAEKIRETEAKLLVIDPAYLALLSDGSEAPNVFKMGLVLGGVSDIGRAEGCTMLLAHHLKKGDRQKRFKKALLSDLSQTGFSERARQWLLLNHRKDRNPSTGESWLQMGVGGSAGHGGDFEVDIDEGTPAIDGRKWEVSVGTPSEEEASGNPTQKSREEKVLDALAAAAEPMSKADLTKATSINNSLLRDQVLPVLLHADKIKMHGEVPRESWSLASDIGC